MVSFLIGFIGSVVAIVGWFGFKSKIALIIGTLAYIVESIMEKDQLNASAKTVDLFIFAIGCVVSAFIKGIPFYVMGMIFINMYSLLIGILSIPIFLGAIRK